MAATDIVDILGVDVRSAPVLARDCSFPIVDWVRRCPPDEVLSNIPIQIGAWEDGTVAPAITDYTDEIDFTDINADECEAPELSTTSTSCELIAPNMAEISVKSPLLNWKDLRTQFCRQRNVLPNQLCVFNSDGSIATGDPLVIDFVKFSTASLANYMIKQLTRAAMIGDDANTNEFDGLYNQLANGWTAPAQQPCGDEYNIAQVIDWGVLTGVGGPASPDATTIAGQSITLWGNVYPIPEGLNLAQLMEDILIDAVEINWADARGGVDMWELHMPWGLKKCMMNTATCMQPCQTCGSDPALNDVNFQDEGLRDRFIRMMNGDVIELMPSGRAVVPMQSRFVADNEMWLGPGSIGGRPSYVLFLDNIDRYLMSFGEITQAGFGVSQHESEMRDILAPDTNDDLMSVGQLQANIETQAFYWLIKTETIKCFRAYMIACAGLICCNRHLWVHLLNIDCCSAIEPCDERVVDVTP